jgi:hypothetical protein
MDERNVDPLLEEVDEMRRRIMAEHGNDYRKVLQFYVELGRRHKEHAASTTAPKGQGRSAG